MRPQTVLHYAHLAYKLSSYPALQDMMQQATPKLGFDYFAITHYVVDPLAEKIAELSSFPQRWTNMVRQLNVAPDGPVATACRSAAAGFPWAELPNKVKLTKKQLETLNAAHASGVGDCFIIPANIPSAISGSICFAVKDGQALPEKNFPAAQYIGCLAYEASLRISAQGCFPSPAPAGLSKRQLDCVLLVARGKSDWEIGKILKISKDTAHKHIQNAMGRLGVVTRTQLVVRALFDSHISFDDALNSK